jgi:hypothetical protein
MLGAGGLVACSNSKITTMLHGAIATNVNRKQYFDTKKNKKTLRIFLFENVERAHHVAIGDSIFCVCEVRSSFQSICQLLRTLIFSLKSSVRFFVASIVYLLQCLEG